MEKKTTMPSKKSQAQILLSVSSQPRLEWTELIWSPMCFVIQVYQEPDAPGVVPSPAVKWEKAKT
jgi:hypothetical protein